MEIRSSYLNLVTNQGQYIFVNGAVLKDFDLKNPLRNISFELFDSNLTIDKIFPTKNNQTKIEASDENSKKYTFLLG